MPKGYRLTFFFFQCNKTLNPITYLKSVWTELFRETCFLYKVFAPTFPTENMSASDLEHAALAPFRFASNLGCGPNPPSRRALQPVRDTSLHPRDPQTLHTFQISAAYLVPGGRFLLLNSTIGTLSLYDLGYSVAHTPSDFPVTSVIWRFRVSAFSAQPTADGQGVRLCVVFHRDVTTEVAIFEMFPAKLAANLVSEHSFPSMVAFALRNDLFAFDCRSSVGVYNFTTGMQTTWRVPDVSTTTAPRVCPTHSFSEPSRNKLILVPDRYSSQRTACCGFTVNGDSTRYPCGLSHHLE
jgi:hypothetical protein